MRKKVEGYKLKARKFNNQGAWSPKASGVITVWARPTSSLDPQVQMKILCTAVMPCQEQDLRIHDRKDRQTSSLKRRKVGEELLQQETLNRGGTIQGFFGPCFLWPLSCHGAQNTLL